MMMWAVTHPGGKVSLIESMGFRFENGGHLVFTNVVSEGYQSVSKDVAAFAPSAWAKVHRHNEGDKE